MACAKVAYYAPKWLLSNTVFARDERQNLRCASRILTNSRYSQQVLRERYGVTAHVVYPGIDTDTFRPVATERQGFVLAVGALHYMKGYRFLVAALSRLPAERRPPLVIAANSAEPEEEAIVRAMAARLGVTLRVENVRDDSRMVQLYNHAAMLVYTPMQEALGLAALEAMACGTPVLAVGEGGVLETVCEGSGGITVPRDERAFAEALEALLADEAARARLGAQGVAYVRERWTWERAVDELERHLTEVAAQREH